MTTPGVFAMLFDESRKILCVRMNYGDHSWTTPGGRVEPGESPLDALRRETFEEAGVRVEPVALVGVYAKPYKDDVVLSFEVDLVEDAGWVPNGEISERRYFDPRRLPDEMAFPVRVRIQDAVAGERGLFRELSTPRSLKTNNQLLRPMQFSRNQNTH